MHIYTEGKSSNIYQIFRTPVIKYLLTQSNVYDVPDTALGTFYSCTPRGKCYYHLHIDEEKGDSGRLNNLLNSVLS